jgi:hypothetical protein
VAAGREAVGGRNLAAVHDPWRDGDRLARALRDDPNKFKLRRYRNSD